MKTITTRIPEEEEEELKKIEEEEGAKRSEVLRRLIGRSIKDWKKEKALKMLEDREVSLRKAAELAGVSYLKMWEMASKQGLEVGYDLDELERDLERI